MSNMNGLLRVAIDGPGGAGKSTIAKAVGKKLGLDYIDTGAMYRAVAYKLCRNNIEPVSSDELSEMLNNTEIDFSEGRIYLDGDDISGEIRTPEISKMASFSSKLPEVREKLVDLQRKMGQTKSVIMDGRDIGTNVLTDAEYKFFLTASAEERARRRYDELILKNEKTTYEEVLKDINERDYEDTHRKLNPLKKADDAIEVDSTDMNIDEVTEYMLKIIGKDPQTDPEKV